MIGEPLKGLEDVKEDLDYEHYYLDSDPKNVNDTQINLHHSQASAAHLFRLHERDEDIVLLREPWINDGKSSTKSYRLYHVNNAGNSIT